MERVNDRVCAARRFLRECLVPRQWDYWISTESLAVAFQCWAFNRGAACWTRLQTIRAVNAALRRTRAVPSSRVIDGKVWAGWTGLRPKRAWASLFIRTIQWVPAGRLVRTCQGIRQTRRKKYTGIGF